MERLKNYLLRNYNLTKDDLDQLKDNFHPGKIDAGEYFVKAGKICYRLGFIEEGVMRYTYFPRDDREFTCSFASEEEFIGEPESFLSQNPCRLSIRAAIDCRVMTITLDDYKDILEKYPPFSKIFEDIDYRTVLSLLEKRTFLAGIDAVTRYRHFIDKYPSLIQRVPLGYIASYLDITQQSLSRIRRQVY
jgi:CRP-like cAMP-binding protein